MTFPNRYSLCHGPWHVQDAVQNEVIRRHHRFRPPGKSSLSTWERSDATCKETEAPIHTWHVKVQVEQTPLLYCSEEQYNSHTENDCSVPRWLTPQSCCTSHSLWFISACFKNYAAESMYMYISIRSIIHVYTAHVRVHVTWKFRNTSTVSVIALVTISLALGHSHDGDEVESQTCLVGHLQGGGRRRYFQLKKISLFDARGLAVCM